MGFHIHTYCAYTRQGVLGLIDEIFETSQPDEVIHIFDLIENPHPILLLNKIKNYMRITLDEPQKIIAICNKQTADFLRKFSILCITPTESILNWVDILKKAKAYTKWSVTSIPELEHHYASKPLTNKDFFILEHLCQGYSFSEISELSGLNAKIVYARLSKIKCEFNLERNNIHLAYTFILESRTNYFHCGRQSNYHR